MHDHEHTASAKVISRRPPNCKNYGNYKHGKANTPIFRIWNQIIQRCRNPNHAFFKRYGGRGIAVCERWQSFENFYTDMGDPPAGLTLERQNNNLGYGPDNCIWATRKAQARNRRTNRILTLNGESMCIAAWCDRLGFHQQTIETRLSRGWSDERALTTPLIRGRSKRPTL